MTGMSAQLLTPDAPAAMLFVRTQRIEEPVDLLEHVPADLSGAWIRHSQGFVARGTAWSVQTAGPHRFAAASAAFRELVADARVDDEVRVRTSGLISLGSFSYADSSARPSTLMVPRALLGVHDGEAFLTVVGVGEEPELPASWRDLFPSGPVPEAPLDELDVEADHTPDEYQSLVQDAVAEIRAGRAAKVVLSERTTVRSEGALEPAVMLTRLARAYPSTWVYHLQDIVGASPEMLAQTEDGRVFSRVLAGSRPVADDGELDEIDRRAFRTDAKELSEHAFAVDSVVERLAGLAEEIEVSGDPFVLRLPGLEHLASDVSARLRGGHHQPRRRFAPAPVGGGVRHPARGGRRDHRAPGAAGPRRLCLTGGVDGLPRRRAVGDRAADGAPGRWPHGGDAGRRRPGRGLRSRLRTC